MEPAAKRAKTEAGEAPVEEVADIEATWRDLPEQEKDASSNSSPKIKEAVSFLTQDTTLNVMNIKSGNMLTPITGGGMQFLLAGARANSGVKSGRYMFEVKVVEAMALPENKDGPRCPAPRHYLRIGLSTEGSSLILGETEDSACFDNTGYWCHNKQWSQASSRFNRDDIVAVLVNLDSRSTNRNTVSLFVNGKRASKPVALPENLKGKALYPTFTYRGVTLHYNFGPISLAPLPFKCPMLQDAASSDIHVTSLTEPLDGQYDVLFPVCLPDEGTFHWLDEFLRKNPKYVELSDRMLLDWAEKSGFWRNAGNNKGFFNARQSNDRPDMAFGVQMWDDLSVREVLRNVAPLQKRHYVVMEVKSNLLKDERKDLIRQFKAPGFKLVAMVMAGEPPADFKKRSQEVLLRLKQEASDVEFSNQLQEDRQKKLEELRQKATEINKKNKEARAEKEKADKKRMLMEELATGKSSSDAAEEQAEEKDEPMPTEEDVKIDTMQKAPKVELTLEEKRLWFAKSYGKLTDLSVQDQAANFLNFSFPTEDEGFDEIRQEWSNASECNKLLSNWKEERKFTTRVEDVAPGAWFQQKHKDWQKVVGSWHSVQNSFKSTVAKHHAQKVAAQKATPDGSPEKKEGEDKDEPPKEEFEAFDIETVDIFRVDDPLNLGGKPATPLFSKFQFEDWAMMNLRWEVNLLVHSFRKDVTDKERTDINVEHLPFYYQKYFKKALNPEFYGVKTVKDMLGLIEDTVIIDKSDCLGAELPEDLECPYLYVLLTEEARRDRSRRLHLGDKTAALNVQQAAGAVPGATSAWASEQHQERPAWDPAKQQRWRPRDQQGWAPQQRWAPQQQWNAPRKWVEPVSEKPAEPVIVTPMHAALAAMAGKTAARPATGSVVPPADAVAGAKAAPQTWQRSWQGGGGGKGGWQQSWKPNPNYVPAWRKSDS